MIFTEFSPKIIDIKSESFGIVVINIEGENIEIATFRKDRECDGRHADATYADSMEEDAVRRDFTVNALYQDKDGKVYDPTGFGVSDIKDDTLRFIGSPKDRCQEDNLRILRYFRFLSTKITKVHPDQWFEVVNLIKDDDFKKSFLSRVSGERIGKEMKKTISGKNAPAIIKVMIGLFADYQIFPKELYDLQFQPTYSKYHMTENNFEHTLAVFKICVILLIILNYELQLFSMMLENLFVRMRLVMLWTMRLLQLRFVSLS